MLEEQENEMDMVEEFCGFDEPVQNWSTLPHSLINLLPMIGTLGELKVILYILRHTWGFNDVWKKITLDEFQYGRKRKDGTRLDSGTGLAAPTIRDGLRKAEEHGFICVEVDDSDLARIHRFFSLKMKSDQGESIFPLEPKTLDLSEKQSLHRSEKDTLERNHRETTCVSTASESDNQFDQLFPRDAEDVKPITAPFTARDLQTEEGRLKAQAHLLRAQTAAVEENPWLQWYPEKISTRGGVDREHLQHIGWLIEQITGICPIADEVWIQWRKAYETMYK